MLVRKNQLVLALAAVFGTLVCANAYATNGYFSHGYGNKNKGLAGAGVAFPQDAMQAATNPAGMAMVGDRVDIGLAFFSPMREYSVKTAGAGPFPLGLGTVESDNELFYIPHLAYNHMLSPNNSFGVTVYGNGGMNTEYPAEATPGGAGTFGAGTAGVNLSQLFVAATLAHKFGSVASVGVSGIFAYQRFEATGLQGFAPLSTDGASVTNRGSDSSNGYGVKIGGQANLGSVVTLGASYQTKMRMDQFKKYRGLFADQGDFDIPATATVGAAFHLGKNHTIALDVHRIWYSDVEAIGNPLNPSFSQCLGGAFASCLGGDNGPGFGWEDITVIKLGYQWQVSPDFAWRIGYSDGDQPIPSDEVLFNILAPGVQEQHYTTGFTFNTSPTSEVNLALMYSPENTVSGFNAAATGQIIDLTMKQYEFEISFGLKF